MKGGVTMFQKALLVLAVLGTAAVFCSSAPAQVVVYSPVAPAVSYSPVVTTYSPVVTAAPTVVYSPRVVTYSPVMTTYSPVVTSYSPVVSAYAPVVAARPVLIRPKVYVAGQPVRNFFRAITP
jgi:hypothetical protein